MANLEEKVKEILADILPVKPEDIVPTAALIEDLKATSIDLVEILTAAQNAFDVNITEEEVQKIRTVQDIVDYLRMAIAKKAAQA